MSQEIIYTSAPQGLRPGSFGFCTVATTPGMTSTLAERLEAISGYRHVYSPGDVKEHLNPIVHSHLIFRVAGKPQNILSRVANAGFDYSQRTNKLAHHVVLDASELVGAGPAWVLAQPGFSETTWSGAPRLLPKGRACPRGESELRVCTAWQKATGDAGWAGVLAQQTLRGGKTAYLIFPEGMDVLPLLQEALALLPAARRWDVTFSTFFTRLPQGVECAWRCVLANSTEAIAAVSKQEGLIIELGRTLGLSPDNDLVLAARTGKSNTPQPKAAAKSAPTPTAPPSYADEDDFLDELVEIAADNELRLAPPEFKGKEKGRPTPVTRSGGPPKLPPKTSRGKRVAITAGLIAFTTVLVASVPIYFFSGRPTQVTKMPEQSPVEQLPKGEDGKKPETPKDLEKDSHDIIDANGKEKEATVEEREVGKAGEGVTGKSRTLEDEKLAEEPQSKSETAPRPQNLPPGKVAEHMQVNSPEPKESAGNGVGGIQPATPGKNSKKIGNWKWPIEPVPSVDPAMLAGLPNSDKEPHFQLEKTVSGLELLGMSGRRVRLSHNDKSEAWRLIHEDSIGTKRDLLSLAISEDTVSLEWKVANTRQVADELRHLSACSIVAILVDGEKRLLPLSSQRVRGLRYGIADDTKTESFYLPNSVLNELHIVGIEFDKGNSDWDLDPAPVTSSTSRKCVFNLKFNDFVQSRLEIRPVNANGSEYCVHWDVHFGGQRVTKKQCERFAEISALADDEDKCNEKITTLVSELVERSKVQNPSAEFTKETTAKTTELAGLRTSNDAIRTKYRSLEVDSPTAHFIRDKWPGMLHCFVARRVKYPLNENQQDVDIPLVRIGGD